VSTPQPADPDEEISTPPAAPASGQDDPESDRRNRRRPAEPRWWPRP